MNIQERAEGTEIREGAQVTSTRVADYFYFKRGNQVVNVRIPKDPESPEIIDVGSRILIPELTIGPPYGVEDFGFVSAAAKNGGIQITKLLDHECYRCSVTSGNVTRPMDMSRELLVELGVQLP